MTTLTSRDQVAKAAAVPDAVAEAAGPTALDTLRVADEFADRMTDWWVAVADAIRRRLTHRTLAAALSAPAPANAVDDALVDILNRVIPHGRLAKGVPRWRIAKAEDNIPDLARIILDIMGRSSQIEFGLDLTDPFVIEEARRNAGALIVGVRRQTRLQVRDVITRGVEGGMSRREVERAIRGTIGMSPQQATAWENMRVAADNAVAYQNIADIPDPLERARVRRAQQYRLQGRTKLRPGMTREQADRMLDQYEQRAIRFRAETIARTETMRASNAGRWAGVDQQMRRGLLPANMQKVWVTTPDDRTCPICRPLDGKIVDMGQGFLSNMRGLDPRRLLPGRELTTSYPPIHPRCLPGDAPVLPGGRITAVTSRPFKGDLVVITTARGHQLTCTANHPVLTPSGWVAASLLDVGGEVITDSRVEGVAAGDEQHDHVVATAAEIADAFRRSPGVTASEVEMTAEDLHADAADGEVAVVWADRGLLLDREASIYEQVHHVEFERRHGQEPVLAGAGNLGPVLVAERNSAGCVVCGGDLGGSLDAGHPRPLERFALGLGSQSDALLGESSGDERTAHVVSGGELVDGLPGEVPGDDRLVGELLAAHSTDRIVAVDARWYEGDVYNFDCGGWYGSGGVITSNCRCTLSFQDPGGETPEALKKPLSDAIAATQPRGTVVWFALLGQRLLTAKIESALLTTGRKFLAEQGRDILEDLFESLVTVRMSRITSQADAENMAHILDAFQKLQAHDQGDIQFIAEVRTALGQFDYPRVRALTAGDVPGERLALPAGNPARLLPPAPQYKALNPAKIESASGRVLEELTDGLLSEADRVRARGIFDELREAMRDEARAQLRDIDTELGRILGSRQTLQPVPRAVPSRVPGSTRFRLVDPATKQPIPAEWEWYYHLPDQTRDRLRRSGLIQTRRRNVRLQELAASGPDELASMIADAVPEVRPGDEMLWWVDQQMRRLDLQNIADGRPPMTDLVRFDSQTLEQVDIDRLMFNQFDDNDIRNLLDREIVLDTRDADGLLPTVRGGRLAPWEQPFQSWLEDVVAQLDIIEGASAGDIAAAQRRFNELVPPVLQDRFYAAPDTSALHTVHSEILTLARRAERLVDVDPADGDLIAMRQSIRVNEGFTWSPGRKDFAGAGKAVALKRHEGIFVPPGGVWSDDDLANTIVRYLDRADVRRALQDPTNHLGAWVDPDDPQHRLYLDVTRIVRTHREARDLAAANDQIAYFDLDTFTQYTRPRRVTRIRFVSEDGTVRLLDVGERPRPSTSMNYVGPDGVFPLDPIEFERIPALAEMFDRPGPFIGTVDNLPKPGAGSALDDSGRSLVEALRSRHPELTVDVTETGDYITLNRVIVPPNARGQGLGSAFMQDLIDEADLSGRDIFLTPSADFGGSVPRLRDFYEQFGFRPNKGRSRDFRSRETMIRDAVPDREIRRVTTRDLTGDAPVRAALDAVERMGLSDVPELVTEATRARDLIDPAILGLRNPRLTRKHLAAINRTIEQTYQTSPQAAARSVQNNLLSVFNRADAVDEAWYAIEHRRMQAFAELINEQVGPGGVPSTLERHAAATALMSPNLDYTRNKLLADRLVTVLARNEQFEVTQDMIEDFMAWKKGRFDRSLLPRPGLHRPSDVVADLLASQHPVIHEEGFLLKNTGDMIAAIEAYRSPSPGAFMVWRGAKRASFYRNFVTPFDNRFVTLDTWHYRAMVGTRRKLVGPKGKIATLAEFESGYYRNGTPIYGYRIGKDGKRVIIKHDPQKILQAKNGSKPLGVRGADGGYLWHHEMTVRAWEKAVRDGNLDLTLNGFQARVWEQMRIDAGYDRTVIVEEARIPDLTPGAGRSGPLRTARDPRRDAPLHVVPPADTPTSAVMSNWEPDIPIPADVERLFGAPLDVLFPETGGPTRTAPFPRAGRHKRFQDYDHDLVQSVLADPAEKARLSQMVDPRRLSSTQPSIVRGALDYYLTDEYARTGKTFEAGDNIGNEFPVVYVRDNGNGTKVAMILSGHHRASAALLQGRPLRAIVIEGGYGNPR
jgi:GNAT superfamily N-acetyltransferase